MYRIIFITQIIQITKEKPIYILTIKIKVTTRKRLIYDTCKNHEARRKYLIRFYFIFYFEVW